MEQRTPQKKRTTGKVVSPRILWSPAKGFCSWKSGLFWKNGAVTRLISGKCMRNRLKRHSLLSSIPASNERIFFPPMEPLLYEQSEQTKHRNLKARVL